MTCWITASGPSSMARRERPVAAVRAVGVERGVRTAPTARRASASPRSAVGGRPAVLARHAGGCPRCDSSRTPPREHGRRPRRSPLERRWSARSPAAWTRTAGARSQRPRHGLADHPVASPPEPRVGRERGHQLLAPPFTRHARSSQTWTTVFGRSSHAEHRVEGRDAVGLGGRHLQALARVVEAALADPSDARLQRVEHGRSSVRWSSGRARDAEVARGAARRRPSRSRAGRAPRRPPRVPRRRAPPP